MKGAVRLIGLIEPQGQLTGTGTTSAPLVVAGVKIQVHEEFSKTKEQDLQDKTHVSAILPDELRW